MEAVGEGREQAGTLQGVRECRGGSGPVNCAQTSVGLGVPTFHPWRMHLASSWDPTYMPCGRTS